MANCCCQSNCTSNRPRRRFSPFRLLFQAAFLYAALVFGGGTLINTGHPVAVETGRLMQTVTLVKPSIHWADSKGHAPLSMGLRVLARGVPLGKAA